MSDSRGGAQARAKVLAGAAGIIGLVLLVLSMFPRVMVGDQVDVTVFSGVPVQLAEQTDEVRLFAPSLLKHAVIAVPVTPAGENAASKTRHVLVLPRALAVAAALGGLLLLYALPLLLGGDGAFWLSMIKEPEGGYSLSKMQLLIWFFPTAAILCGLSIPQLQLTINTPLMALLGMSGITTALGAATTPSPETVAKREEAKAAAQGAEKAGDAKHVQELQAFWTKTIGNIIPAVKTVIDRLRPAAGTDTQELDEVAVALQALSAEVGKISSATQALASQTGKERTPHVASLRDLVTDWQDQADISRYQCLMLTLLGALVVTAMWAATMQVPTIPSEFLGLIGVSQAAYLTTKGVKEFKASNPA